MTKALVIVIGIVLLIALAPVLTILAWQWIVPDIFAGAVEQHILPAAISYWQAWKLIILLAVLGVSGRGSSKK